MPLFLNTFKQLPDPVACFPVLAADLSALLLDRLSVDNSVPISDPTPPLQKKMNPALSFDSFDSEKTKGAKGTATALPKKLPI